jgi:hypothetical protein
LAVLGRVLLNSAERVDLPDLLSIDSYAAGDWKYYMQSLVGTTKPYILAGFDVINPGNAIGLPTCSFRVANSIVYYPGSAAGPFYYGLPETNAAAAPLVPQLRTNSTNYVYLTLGTFETASDTRALWDPDRNGGAGGEFIQDINTESVIQAQLNVSTGSFPVNTVPLAIVTVDASAITSITDARDMMFRLGTGGIAPDPLATFPFPEDPATEYARIEPPNTLSVLSDPNPFQGGDKNIKTMKQWMDAVMTKLMEIGGTTYWYEDTTTYSLFKIFHDALATTWKSKGAYTHSSATPGLLSWSEDIYVKSVTSPRDLVVRASGGSPLQINNEQTAFIGLIREQRINSLDNPVSFTNGQTYVNTVNGGTGRFANLRKGDWVKKATDKDTLFLQVVEFYNAAQSPGNTITSPTGSTTNAADARCIYLSAAYQGVTSQATGDRASYDRGEYLVTDIQVVSRTNDLLNSTGGDLLWFATRCDDILAISSISATTVSGTVTVADGTGAIVSASAHGMIDGDRITVTAPLAHAGTYTIDVIDSNSFTFKTSNNTLGSFTGFYGLATTTSTSVNGFLKESANHGLESGESVTIAGTSGFNGAYFVNVRSATVFQFPLAATHVTENTGTMTLARLDVRSEEGITKVVQGETIEIGSGTIVNMQAFIGMTALDQTFPIYTLPGSYGTFNNGANYNGLATDNLTARVSKNTAMMMDKAQDKTIRFMTNAVEAFVATDVTPTLQNISFTPPSSTITIVQPGSPGNATFTLPDIGSPLQLAANQCAYVTINRNASSSPGFTIASIALVPVSENIFIFATRLAGPEIYLWNGQAVLDTVPLAPSDVPLVECDYFDPLSTSLPTGTVTVDNATVQANELVVFGNLSSNANRLYKAVGVGSNITSWTALHKFEGRLDPVVADTIMVRKGQGFAIQIGKFNGTKWVFNDKVRYFNNADYWEESNLVTAALADNSSGPIFTVAWAGSEHILIDFSIVRSTARETGTMRIVTDGALAEVSSDSSYVNGNSGVTFVATVTGPNLTLTYSTTSTGAPAAMKYIVRRWSSGAGGPGGVPSYSGAAPVPTPAAAPVNSLQFNSGGNLAGNVNFQVDVSDLSVSWNGLRQGILSSPITITNNQPSFLNLFAITTAFPFAIVEYSITKDGFARVGHLQVAYDGSNVACNDSFVETGATGVVLQAIISGGFIQFQYTSTNGSGNGSFKYAWRKWT